MPALACDWTQAACRLIRSRAWNAAKTWQLVHPPCASRALLCWQRAPLRAVGDLIWGRGPAPTVALAAVGVNARVPQAL
jgi:hypothetical protein